MMTFKIEKGAISKAPLFDRRPNYKNWMAVLMLSQLDSNKVERTFLKTPYQQTSYLYYVSRLKEGDVVECASEKDSKRRWHGVVRSIDKEQVTFEVCASYSEVLQHLKRQRRLLEEKKNEGSVRILNLTYYWASKSMRSIGVYEPSDEEKRLIREELAARRNDEEGHLGFQHLKARADKIIEIACKYDSTFVLIGGVPFLTSVLEKGLRSQGYIPLYAHGSKGDAGAYSLHSLVFTTQEEESYYVEVTQ